MISIMANGEDIVQGIKQYVADTPDDIANLPTRDHAGSVCFVVSNGAIYMLNNKKEWVEI